MMKENEQDQIGESEGSVIRERNATDQNSGELTIEELAKVAGGQVIGGAAVGIIVGISVPAAGPTPVLKASRTG